MTEEEATEKLEEIGKALNEVFNYFNCVANQSTPEQLKLIDLNAHLSHELQKLARI